ncbi:flagellar basal body rod protein FlgB [Pontibacillus yanchengensis]|uniref:Flagellar basal body rod protein FlgB n=2 Tax=Pontibacillus yanchengensis TaxID=462910 RepID=A0ACC7VDJ0_9BACI|nr:flagellar basal body rod protein FlgB [Pontibacillus yanchengensis]MYL33136.1 flagellar basal body rod protein FlgB [Pontibacillus yanchengensis]MYL52014.1 flagellar basal body rod protein FlgB [Pontibacillus yanchengensis]
MKLFGSTFQVLENSMNYASQKNQTITNNIANVDTPNFKSKDVVFKDVLANEVNNSLETKRTNEKHIPFSSYRGKSYKVVTNSNTTYNHNGNNVDMDKEMSDLAKNQIYYQALVDRLNGKFRSLQSVLKGGQ